MGRTFRVAVNRGETLAHTISIDEGRLLGGDRPPVEQVGYRSPVATIRFPQVVAAPELTPGKADFIECSARSLIRRDGATGQVKWDAFHPAKPYASDHDPARWLGGHGTWSGRGELAAPPMDLDGDGTRDLVFYSRYAPALLAVSGADGSMLWNYVAELDRPGGPKDRSPDVDAEAAPYGVTAGAVGMADVDRDGTPDLCATFVFSKSPRPKMGRREEAGDRWHRSVVVAVSGRSGRQIWTNAVEPGFVESFDEYEVRPAELVGGRGKPRIAFVATTKWLGLDPATGRMLAGPVELGFTPLRPVAHADVDGDGEPEIVAMEGSAGDQDLVLRVFSVQTGGELWNQTVGAPYDASEEGFRNPGDPPEPGATLPSCPLVVDLDQDGRSEIVVPDSGPMPPLSGYRGVRLLDGRTGATRWRRAMRPKAKQWTAWPRSSAVPISTVTARATS